MVKWSPPTEFHGGVSHSAVTNPLGGGPAPRPPASLPGRARRSAMCIAHAKARTPCRPVDASTVTAADDVLPGARPRTIGRDSSRAALMPRDRALRLLGEMIPGAAGANFAIGRNGGWRVALSTVAQVIQRPISRARRAKAHHPVDCFLLMAAALRPLHQKACSGRPRTLPLVPPPLNGRPGLSRSRSLLCANREIRRGRARGSATACRNFRSSAQVLATALHNRGQR